MNGSQVRGTGGRCYLASAMGLWAFLARGVEEGSLSWDLGGTDYDIVLQDGGRRRFHGWIVHFTSCCQNTRGEGVVQCFFPFFFFLCTESALKLICCIEQRINSDVLLLLWGNWLSNWVQKAFAAPLHIFNLAKQIPLSLPLFLTGSDSLFSQPTTAFVLAHTIAPEHQRLGLWWLSNPVFSLLDSADCIKIYALWFWVWTKCTSVY